MLITSLGVTLTLPRRLLNLGWESKSSIGWRVECRSKERPELLRFSCSSRTDCGSTYVMSKARSKAKQVAICIYSAPLLSFAKSRSRSPVHQKLGIWESPVSMERSVPGREAN